jgi:hypothetical protein
MALRIILWSWSLKNIKNKNPISIFMAPTPGGSAGRPGDAGDLRPLPDNGTSSGHIFLPGLFSQSGFHL